MLNSPRCWIRAALSRAVPSSSVIFASMMILGIEFTRNDEIGRLVEAGDFLSPLGLSDS